jgi:stress response protein YsnF
VVRKKVKERTEHVRDKVRRTKADVEKVGARADVEKVGARADVEKVGADEKR